MHTRTRPRINVLARPSLRNWLLGVSVLAVWPMCPHSVDGAPPVSLELTVERQVVDIGGDDILFAGELRTCADGAADGFVQMQFRDGTTISLTPIAARLFPSATSMRPTWTLVLLPPLERPATPSDFVRATVEPDAVDPDCDIWDLVGSSVIGGAAISRIRFEVVGELALSTGTTCQSHDYGQFASRADLVAPSQMVKPLDGSDPFPFEADLRIDRDQQAKGFIDAPRSFRGGRYEVWFGTVLPHAEQGFQIFAVGVLADPGEMLTTDDLLSAAAVPAGDTADPDCQIWDLVNGTTGRKTKAAVFEAGTFLKLSPAPR